MGSVICDDDDALVGGRGRTWALHHDGRQYMEAVIAGGRAGDFRADEGGKRTT